MSNPYSCILMAAVQRKKKKKQDTINSKQRHRRHWAAMTRVLGQHLTSAKDHFRELAD